MAGYTFIILIVSCEVGIGLANSRNGDRFRQSAENLKVLGVSPSTGISIRSRATRLKHDPVKGQGTRRNHLLAMKQS